MANVCVLGSGGWGTAVSILLHNNGHSVTLWSYDKTECENLQKYHENKPFLPGIIIPEGITFTSDISACANKDLTVIATPSHGVRNIAKQIREHISMGQIILNISKGIEEETYMTLSEILEEELPMCKIPESPENVSACAPMATPRRVISTSPLVISAAFVLSPQPRPSRIPQQRAITFLREPPSSTPIISSEVYTLNAELMNMS